MRSWIRWMPLFIAEIIAKKHCERLPMNGWTVVNPFKGVFFIVGDQYAKQKERKVDE